MKAEPEFGVHEERVACTALCRRDETTTRSEWRNVAHVRTFVFGVCSFGVAAEPRPWVGPYASHDVTLHDMMWLDLIYL